MLDKTTILIQGKFSLTGILNTEYYSKFHKVVFSIWKDKELDIIFEGIKKKYTNVELVSLELPAIPGSFYNAFNVYYQVCSTLAGLERVETEFIIKTRSDERYTNLEPVLNRLCANPDKIIGHNVFWRPDRVHKFHACDHFIAGKTDHLKRGFEIAKKKCEGLLLLPRVNEDHTHNGAPEQVIHMSILEAKGVVPDLNNSIKITKDNYELVHARELGNYVIRSNMHDRSFTPDNPIIVDNCRAIESLDYL